MASFDERVIRSVMPYLNDIEARFRPSDANSCGDDLTPVIQKLDQLVECCNGLKQQLEQEHLEDVQSSDEEEKEDPNDQNPSSGEDVPADRQRIKKILDALPDSTTRRFLKKLFNRYNELFGSRPWFIPRRLWDILTKIESQLWGLNEPWDLSNPVDRDLLSDIEAIIGEKVLDHLLPKSIVVLRLLRKLLGADDLMLEYFDDESLLLENKQSLRHLENLDSLSRIEKLLDNLEQGCGCMASYDALAADRYRVLYHPFQPAGRSRAYPYDTSPMERLSLLR